MVNSLWELLDRNSATGPLFYLCVVAVCCHVGQSYMEVIIILQLSNMGNFWMKWHTVCQILKLTNFWKLVPSLTSILDLVWWSDLVRWSNLVQLSSMVDFLTVEVSTVILSNGTVLYCTVLYWYHPSLGHYNGWRRTSTGKEDSAFVKQFLYEESF